MKGFVMDAALPARTPPAIVTAGDCRIVVLPFVKINKEMNREPETLSEGTGGTLDGALCMRQQYREARGA